jgi:hypothetical protein
MVHGLVKVRHRLLLAGETKWHQIRGTRTPANTTHSQRQLKCFLNAFRVSKRPKTARKAWKRRSRRADVQVSADLRHRDTGDRPYPQ